MQTKIIPHIESQGNTTIANGFVWDGGVGWLFIEGSTVEGSSFSIQVTGPGALANLIPEFEFPFTDGGLVKFEAPSGLYGVSVALAATDGNPAAVTVTLFK